MHFSSSVFASLAILATKVSSAPLPQLAGEGAACNSLLSQTDNGVGFGIKNAEDNVANMIGGANARRQLAGEGAACNSLLSQTDNGVGFGIKNAEDNVAKTVAGMKLGNRQLDKVSNGFQDIADAANMGSTTSSTTTELDNIDGEMTSGAANLGAQVADTEANTLENIGAGNLGGLNTGSLGTGSTGSGSGTSQPAPPPPGPKGHGPRDVGKRQLDKVSNGFQDIANAAKVGSSTSSLTTELDNVDGEMTSGAANLGAQVADTEANTLENLGAGNLGGLGAGNLGGGSVGGTGQPGPPPPGPRNVDKRQL